MNRLRVDRAPAGAHLPRMRATFLLLPLLLTTGATRLHAQTEFYGRVGAVGANDLLRDVIVNQITVRQSVAPMLAVGGSVPLGPRGFRAGAAPAQTRTSRPVHAAGHQGFDMGDKMRAAGDRVNARGGRGRRREDVASCDGPW